MKPELTLKGKRRKVKTKKSTKVQYTKITVYDTQRCSPKQSSPKYDSNFLHPERGGAVV
jgi:hypothetical protein